MMKVTKRGIDDDIRKKRYEGTGATLGTVRGERKLKKDMPWVIGMTRSPGE